MPKKEPVHAAIRSFDRNLIIDTILNYSQDTIYFKDLESRFLFVSLEQAKRLCIGDPSAAIGKTDFDFFPEDQARAAYEDEQKIMRTGTPILAKVEKLIWPSKEFSWVSASKYPLYDAGGTLIGTWGISRDITVQKLAEEELERVNLQLKTANRQLEVLSSVDSLSGLYNHRYFYEEMQRVFDISRRNAEKGLTASFSICVADIDFFKQINDTYGHLMGDMIIRHVANHIKKEIRHTDIAFRYGGDEFVVLFHGTDKEGARAVAEKLREIIMKTPVVNNSDKIYATISIGVSSFEESSNVNDMIEKADARLYASKKSGRNRVTCE